MKSVNKIDKQNVQDILSLSVMQEGILFHYLSNPNSEEYFSQLSLNISGEISIQAFKEAWNFVIENNEMLRTVFRWDNINKPAQIVLKEQPIKINEYDFTSIDPVHREQEIEKLRIEERKEKFDLKTGPVFRITLCRLAEDNYEMILNNHHILYDGWSMGILLQEFFNTYNSIGLGKILTKPSKNKFKEYLKWLNNQDKEQQEKYWRTYLQGYQNKTLLPIDMNPHNSIKRVDNQLFRLPDGLTNKLEDLAKKIKVTVGSIINTAWGILLQKYNNTDQVIFGTTVSGRPAAIEGLENIVGLFINTVPMIIKNSTQDRICDYISSVNKDAIERQNYECTPLVDIKSYSEFNGQDNLFDSIVVIENFDFFEKLKSDANLLKVNSYNSFEMPNFDLTVEVVLLKDIEVNFIYNAEVFKKKTIEHMSNHLQRVLTEIAENSTRKVSELDILPIEERNQLLFDFNNTARAYESNKTIQQLIEEQVKRTPQRIAVEFEEEKLTYQELNEKANQLARILRKSGVTVETVVGIMLERSLEMVISLLAILKAGGAYLPIDPDYPEERILYMLENSNAKIVITDELSRKEIIFTALENYQSNQVEIVVTKPRAHIKEFDKLPMPDRSLIDLSMYKNKIGMASVNNSISLQTTRGCPYHCLYCHKIWSKFHVHRTAENIYSEIEYYYKKGVRNFAVIDDCFNLDKENSGRLFKMIIKNRLDIQIFFPNGLRGDILTPDYIDLMVEAGTRGINLSLETASPRLQKLLKKNLDLDKFKDVIDYIASKHPEIILELATMHGFPTETEEEALMTLNFIKDVKWLHFPYIHILKIFPNTEMEEFALASGVRKEDILRSRNLAFHELPETLPFPKSFTRQYQSSFLNEYFLDKERLKHVLPVEMKILDESALLQKYNAYLPVDIKSISDLLNFAGIEDFKIPQIENKTESVPSIFECKKEERKNVNPNAKKLLLLDLSQLFSSSAMLYKVIEQPIGLIYLLTYLNQEFGNQIDGRIYKSGNDFDSYEELKSLVEEFKPDLIGIRTLTIFKEFFHETVALLRQWGVEAPIITGGPYASSDYDTILQDKNVNLVMFGEGEYTFKELLEKMLENDFKLPDTEVLQTIKGIGFVENWEKVEDKSRKIIFLDRLADSIMREDTRNLDSITTGDSLAYVMYTSGSIGKPKGVMVEHSQVNNCINWMQDEFRLTQDDRILQRTNLTFDPSVWEIFWPLQLGGMVKLITNEQSKDAEYLIQLISSEEKLAMMYTPASLLTGMTYLLNSKSFDGKLRLPWLLIGAEPINMDVVKNFYTYFDGKIVNTYGPTECTINNTYYYLEQDDPRVVVPIGRPVANNQIYILSRDEQLLPIKISGEICIAGDSVARGYINNAEKTSEFFIDNPCGEGKLYKTGDVGRWLEDGTIEIMGRIDNQVKIRGYRMELGEIETALLKHKSIINCTVIVRDQHDDQDEIQTCQQCGITSIYPDITINEDGICNNCDNLSNYKEMADKYFRRLDDLERLIKENKSMDGKYDCLVLYSGGQGSAYALYTLVQMGVKVLALTYDNGYLTKSDLINIKEITQKLGVDNVVLTHENTDKILRESLETAHTVCKGCFFTSSSIAAEYAYKNNIKVVIGATLSRGQIIENKLLKFYKQGISEPFEIERELFNIQKRLPGLEEKTFEYIGIDDVSDGTVYDFIKTIDFYRYCDISNEDMISYLNDKDSYWKSRKDYAIYSTNCPLKQIGDYAHLQEVKYHYYGAATSWEKRLGHLSLENMQEDLQCNVTPKGYNNFLKRIGINKDILLKKVESKYLTAYYEADDDLPIAKLREHLLESLPEYMIPTYFTKLDQLPLDSNGKINKKALPKPMGLMETGTQYVAPRNEIETKIVEIWQKALQIDRVGIKDSFFALGGNSLSIIKVNEKINKVLDHEIKLMDMFKYHTIEMFMDYYENQFGAEIKEMSVEDSIDAILERFKKGEITMEEADQLMKHLLG
ncbi:MAG: AMP-binding protein [Halanaerobiales bacterium]|nr:AMP-binding protein [Halanaerobiales bacterium]